MTPDRKEHWTVKAFRLGSAGAFLLSQARCLPPGQKSSDASPPPTTSSETTPAMTPTVSLESMIAESPTPEAPLPPVAQEYVNQFPDAGFDAGGLHVNIADTGTKIDISQDLLEQRLRVDSFGLLQVFDDQKTIVAEYDPEQKSWVDIQKLASDLVCLKGKTCINEQYHLDPNSVWFEFNSTGIFRYKDVTDDITGQSLGKALLLEVVSRDNNQKPIVVWFLVQAETFFDPGINKFRFVAQNHFIDKRLGINADGGKTFPLEQWRDWMSKGSMWIYGLLKKGESYSDYITKINTPNITAANFIASGGTVIPSQDLILTPNYQGDRPFSP